MKKKLKKIEITFESFLDWRLNQKEIAEQLFCENNCIEFIFKVNFKKF